MFAATTSMISKSIDLSGASVFFALQCAFQYVSAECFLFNSAVSEWNEICMFFLAHQSVYPESSDAGSEMRGTKVWSSKSQTQSIAFTFGRHQSQFARDDAHVTGWGWGQNTSWNGLYCFLLLANCPDLFRDVVFFLPMNVLPWQHTRESLCHMIFLQRAATHQKCMAKEQHEDVYQSPCTAPNSFLNSFSPLAHC